MHRLENPKTILVGLGIINAIVLVMTIVTVLTGISSDEVKNMANVVQEIEVYEVPSKQEMQDEREQRIVVASEHETQLLQDVNSINENGNYEAFEEKYGVNLATVFAEELENKSVENVTVKSRALNHTTDLQMILVNLDDDTMVYIEHFVLEDEWVPAYVYRKGGAE